jgi:hypothetical protein
MVRTKSSVSQILFMIVRTYTGMCRAFDFVLQNLTTDGTTCTTPYWTVHSFEKLHNRGQSMYNFTAELSNSYAYYCHLPHKYTTPLYPYVQVYYSTAGYTTTDKFWFRFYNKFDTCALSRWRENWLTISQARHAICRTCSRSKMCTQWPSLHKLRVRYGLCNYGWRPSKSQFYIQLSSLFTSLDEAADSRSMSSHRCHSARRMHWVLKTVFIQSCLLMMLTCWNWLFKYRFRVV